MSENIIILSPGQTGQSSTGILARRAAITVGATAMLAISAHVAIPLFFTPVPITLQTLVVLTIGLLMGPRWAFATLALYLAEGAAGLPVFSPFGPGGMLQLHGPTGGYLLSYPFAAALAGWLYQGLGRRTGSGASAARFAAAMISGLAASALILAAGAIWLGVATHEPARLVISQAVVPFLAGDFFKLSLAAAAVSCLASIPRHPKQPSL